MHLLRLRTKDLPRGYETLAVFVTRRSSEMSLRERPAGIACQLEIRCCTWLSLICSWLR